MSSPYYFSSYWNPHQSNSKSSRNYSSSRKSETTTTPSPRVVSIPVHFVESEQKRSDSSAAALKIQKVFRGFLVRKSIQKIVCIRNQVQETEMRLSRKEGVELIAKDPKERLKVNETLMSLLFKLDSVRGIDSGVRDFRRGVIKKAIALQERLDALPPQEEEEEEREEDDSTTADANDGQAVAVAVAEEEEDNNNNEDPPNSNCYDEMSIDHNPQHNRQEEDVKEIVEDCSNTLNCFQVADEKMVQGGDCEINDCKEEEETVTVEGGGGITMKDEDNSNNKEEEDNMKTMMRMMRELIEKNELQTRMINSLNHRVGQLEKAFLCDRLRRSNNKKKKLQQQQDGKHPSS